MEQRRVGLSKSMTDSARLVEQMSAELDARLTTVRQLQAGAAEAQEVASLHREHGDAVRRMLTRS
jgi:hypothetical protein